jgi:undecaprenyl diphosphate synthase
MAAFDPERSVPQHIAVIMDGNGRWAQQRGLPRRDGHRAGADSVEECLRVCGEIGVGYLTLYAFSTDNWKRPEAEITALMGLLTHFLKDKMATLMENRVRLHVIGQTERLALPIRRQLDRSIAKTSGNDGLNLVVALSYGSREEIVEATRRLMEEAKRGETDPAALSTEMFSRYLHTSAIPDPDLLIRTSGEFRISNFLLWQISYTEIHITDTLWPDFRREHLLAAVGDFQGRQRRFGAL